MANPTATDLAKRQCVPCEGGAKALDAQQVAEYLKAVPHWKLTEDSRRIQREWRVKDFMTGLDFFQRIAAVAEQEDHHPDLHLAGYRNVTIELWTHALGGLSENDFILASKIDTLPVELKN